MNDEPNYVKLKDKGRSKTSSSRKDHIGVPFFERLIPIQIRFEFELQNSGLVEEVLQWQTSFGNSVSSWRTSICVYLYLLIPYRQIFCTTRKGVQQTAVFLAKTLHTDIIHGEAKMKLNQAVYMIQDTKIQGGFCISSIEYFIKSTAFHLN